MEEEGDTMEGGKSNGTTEQYASTALAPYCPHARRHGRGLDGSKLTRERAASYLVPLISLLRKHWSISISSSPCLKGRRT